MIAMIYFPEELQFPHFNSGGFRISDYKASYEFLTPRISEIEVSSFILTNEAYLQS
jgi:hypothetical protein